jgi:hypothetical protein
VSTCVGLFIAPKCHASSAAAALAYAGVVWWWIQEREERESRRVAEKVTRTKTNAVCLYGMVKSKRM